MKRPALPKNENERQHQLESYEVLNTPEEPEFDQLTQLAAAICDTPISLISLIDKERQWFKSHYGLEARETPREYAFCAHAVYEQKLLLVPDARIDERFSVNPLVTGEPHVVFYAGAPLIDEKGFTLGTLCAIDTKPKQLNERQLNALKIIAQQVVMHLTLKKRTIQNLAYENNFEKLAAKIPGAIFQFKMLPNGKSYFPLVSSKFEDIYEFTADEVKLDASHTPDRIHPKDKEATMRSMTQSMENMTDWSAEYRIVLPKKGTRWVRVLSHPEKHDDQSVVWSGFMTDITEEKIRDRALKNSSQLISLGEVAAGIAHEVNNPLSVVSGAIQLIQSSINDPKKIQEKLVIAEKAVNRIYKIINSLRKFSRMSEDNDEKRNVILKSIIEESIQLTSTKALDHNVQVEFQSHCNDTILANEIEIEQTLINLINNSIDAIKALQERWIKITLAGDQKQLKVTITDSGPGIPKELQEKIFQPFFTTKPRGEGTGLGLSIISGILKDHNATIKLNTESAHTCFEIVFSR